ncbi:MAG: hypothetical protein GWP27_05370, partial [Bacteroidetes bacterium]|nr:hypothetical protein [Bacteroidota bacterium]
MRPILIIFLFAAFTSTAQENSSPVVPKVQKQPYVDFYDDDQTQKYSEGMFLNGKKHGPWIYYYQNGKKQEESNYNNGKHSGKVTYWYDDGQRKAEGYFKLYFQNGLLTTLRDSIYRSWYPNGNQSEKG